LDRVKGIRPGFFREKEKEGVGGDENWVGTKRKASSSSQHLKGGQRLGSKGGGTLKKGGVVKITNLRQVRVPVSRTGNGDPAGVGGEGRTVGWPVMGDQGLF